MSANGNKPEIKIAAAKPPARGTGPILILAILFVVASFLAWYFTWFGRGLSDEEISSYLDDAKHPRHVQHALLQVEQRIERRDPAVRKWYPQLVALSSNAEVEFRLTAAWVMGFDNQAKEFHEALLRLSQDPEPIVRRNAALALVRFNDTSGRGELVSVLQPYAVKTTADGVIDSTLHAGSLVGRRALLARVLQDNGNIIEVRSPLTGTVAKLTKENGARVKNGDEVLTLKSDDTSIWEALRGLSLVGEAEDLGTVNAWAREKDVSPRIKEQATLTAKAIESRSNPK